MHIGVHHFCLGDFDCFSLSDGFHRYQLAEFCSGIPKTEVENVLRQRNLPFSYIETPYTCLLIVTGEHLVLIDVGAGAFSPHTGRLLANLRKAGFEPEDIDTIILTHAHPDHIGGNLDDNGQPIFTRAGYFIWKAEWDFWFSEEATLLSEGFSAMARQQLTPVLDRLQDFDSEEAIVPGITAIAAPGHTPGHMALSIASKGKQLIHIGDAVLHPLHLEHPNWLPIFDWCPNKAAQTKQRLFDRASQEEALVFAHHLSPFPNLGHVIRQKTGWSWQPTEESGTH